MLKIEFTNILKKIFSQKKKVKHWDSFFHTEEDKPLKKEQSESSILF